MPDAGFEQRPRVAASVIAAAISAPLGALLCGLINFGLLIADVDVRPLRVLFGTAISFPFPVRPLGLVTTLVGLLVLAPIVALIVWLASRAASRHRGFAAVFFGAWLAVIIGGWLTTLATSPLVAADLRYPADMVGQLILQRISAGGGWGLYWGWLTGLICATIFMISNRARRGSGHAAGPVGSTAWS